MIPVKRIYLLYLQTVLIIAGPGVTICNASKQHVHGKRHIRDFKIGDYGLPTVGREAFGTGTRQRVLP